MCSLTPSKQFPLPSLRYGKYFTTMKRKKTPQQPLAIVPKDAPRVTITTDGGCWPNPGGVGAWAAILRSGTAAKIISGRASGTTNNRMEYTAAIEALRSLKRPCWVTLRTDSQILQGLINTRRTLKRSPKNPDLVSAILAQLAIHRVNAVFVRGHSGDPDNETCDAICTRLIKSHGAFD